MPNSLLIEHRGPVALLTLNRPEKLNALNNELIAALDEIEFDRSAARDRHHRSGDTGKVSSPV
jgi:enoyl-CoA hydratase/carnithine racemase